MIGLAVSSARFTAVVSAMIVFHFFINVSAQTGWLLRLDLLPNCVSQAPRFSVAHEVCRIARSSTVIPITVPTTGRGQPCKRAHAVASEEIRTMPMLSMKSRPTYASRKGDPPKSVQAGDYGQLAALRLPRTHRRISTSINGNDRRECTGKSTTYRLKQGCKSSFRRLDSTRASEIFNHLPARKSTPLLFSSSSFPVL